MLIKKRIFVLYKLSITNFKKLVHRLNKQTLIGSDAPFRVLFYKIMSKKMTTGELAVKRPIDYKKLMTEASVTQMKYLQHNESVKKLLGQVDAMITEMDKMITHDILRHKLKSSAKNFIRELESWNSANYHDAIKTNTIEQTNEYINEHEEIQSLIQDVHTDYRPHLIEVLKTFIENGYNTEETNKRVAKEQFTLLKEFFAPDIVKKQLKRIDENIFEYTVIHVSEVITREQVLNLPKVDPLTIDFLDKMFRYCRLQWK